MRNYSREARQGVVYVLPRHRFVRISEPICDVILGVPQAMIRQPTNPLSTTYAIVTRAGSDLRTSIADDPAEAR